MDSDYLTRSHLVGFDKYKVSCIIIKSTKICKHAFDKYKAVSTKKENCIFSNFVVFYLYQRYVM